MARTVFEWQGKEYEFEEKTSDWYWAVGIIATALAIVSVLFGNILLALVIVTAAGAVALQAAKRPKIHRFVVDDAGLSVDDAFFPFSAMLSFSVLEYLDADLPPSLSIKTTSLLAPHITIPLVNVNADALYEFLYQHVTHEPHDVPLPDRLAALFRF